MSDQRMLTTKELTPLVVTALRKASGTASTVSIRKAVEGAVDAEVCSVMHGSGHGTELSYRLRWAIVDLCQRGVIERTSRGMYRLLEDRSSAD